MSATVAQLLAAEASEFNFSNLPGEVVAKAKQLVLHALGAGLFGHVNEPAEMMQGLAEELGGPPESTVIGSGLRTSCLSAALANTAKVAWSGFSDKAYLSPEARFHAGSQSHLIPALLAVGERVHAHGPDFLTAVVCAYEMANKLYGSMRGNFGLLDRGWSTDCIGRPGALALASGRLLDLNQEQLMHALGIGTCFNLTPYIVYSPTSRYNLRTPMSLMVGLLGALLAKKGFTGALDAFEGVQGLNEMVLGGEMDLESLRRPRKDWTILYTGINRYGGDGDMAGFIEATLTLVNQHDIKPQDIEKVVVRTTKREATRLGDPTKDYLFFPKAKEKATHSCFYVTAVAIVDRKVGYERFSDETVRGEPDPQVVELMRKISVEADPKFEGFNLRGSAQITKKNGQIYECEVLQPKGIHPMNPMTASENEEQFRTMAGRVLGQGQMDRIVESVQEMEKLNDVGELVRLAVIPGAS